MKSIIPFLIATLGLSSVSLAKTKEYISKTCTKTVTVEAVCAGYAEEHPIDPIFTEEFIYLSPKSYKTVKEEGLNPRKIKDWLKVCDRLNSYAIFDLFGDQALPIKEIDFTTVDVEFIVECK